MGAIMKIRVQEIARSVISINKTPKSLGHGREADIKPILRCISISAVN